MERKNCYQYENICVVNRGKGMWAVLDIEGAEIVPFGKYSWIDGFDHGLARVKVFDKEHHRFKWGIIDMQGEEVLPPEFDEIWNFLGKGRSDTRVVKDGIFHQFDLNDRTFGGNTTCFEHAIDYEEYPGCDEAEVYSDYCDAIEGLCYDPYCDYDDEEMEVMYWNLD